MLSCSPTLPNPESSTLDGVHLLPPCLVEAAAVNRPRTHAAAVQASKDPEPENELQQARAVAQRAQRHAESLQAALASSHRMLARSGSHAVTPMAARPISPARPSSAPLPRPATAFALTGPRSRGPPGGAGRLQVALSPRDRPPWRTVEVRDAAAERPRPRPFLAVQCPCAPTWRMHVS